MRARKARKVVVCGIVLRSPTTEEPAEGAEEPAEAAEEPTEEPSFNEPESRLRHWKDFDEIYPRWKQFGLDVDWRATFPELSGVPAGESLDLVDHLYKLDMGVIHKAIYDSESMYDDPAYGHFPLLATILSGDNLSSSFSEALISVANLVMPEGRTVLSPAMLEKLAVLRMNRKFMLYMKKEHPELAVEILKKQLAMLVDREIQKATAAASSSASSAAASPSTASAAPVHVD